MTLTRSSLQLTSVYGEALEHIADLLEEGNVEKAKTLAVLVREQIPSPWLLDWPEWVTDAPRNPGFLKRIWFLLRYNKDFFEEHGFRADAAAHKIRAVLPVEN